MYNVKKCSKCGGNVPEGNAVCNNCGNKMSFFGGSNVIGGGSKNANTIPGGNPFESKKNNNSGCVVFIIINLFLVLPFISFFFEIYDSFMQDLEHQDSHNYKNYTCYDLCDGNYVESKGRCLCDNGNIYDEYGEVEHYSTGIEVMDNSAKCRVYCDDTSASYVVDKCICSNGEYYDIEGNSFIEILPDKKQDEDSTTNRTVSEWYNDVTSGKGVVTVLCESNNYNCSNYRPEIENLARNRKFNLYYFDIDKLDENDKTILTTTYTFRSNTNLDIIPYTFIVKDNRFITSTLGHATTDHVEALIDIYDLTEE